MTLEKLLEVIKQIGWTVSKEDRDLYLLRICSPAGQDFSIYVTYDEAEEDLEKFLDKIYDRYNEFDTSYETYLWLDNEGHGKNGAPYNMKNVYEDMEWCENEIMSLYETLKSMYDDDRDEVSDEIPDSKYTKRFIVKCDEYEEEIGTEFIEVLAPEDAAFTDIDRNIKMAISYVDVSEDSDRSCFDGHFDKMLELREDTNGQCVFMTYLRRYCGYKVSIINQHFLYQFKW